MHTKFKRQGPRIAAARPALWLLSGSILALSSTAAFAIPPAPPTWTASDATPSFRIVKGVPISPATAVADLGPNTLSNDGICRDNPGNTTLCPVGGRPRAPEIVELAAGLRGDPDLIFEFVRNSIDTEFIFGSSKGALGTLLDRSGSSFDQAVLMVELLRQSNITARYRFGEISLTGTQFTEWTGISDARVACEVLAAGGIPAVVNGGTACGDYGSLTSVVLSHVWVEAVIGGQTYQFDPAFKAYDNHSTLDVRAGMGLASGDLFDNVTSTVTHSSDGRTSGNFDRAELQETMDGYASQLASRLHQPDVQSANLSDALGGRDVIPGVRPANGWRSSALPHVAQVRATWSGGVPDQYRTQMQITGATQSGKMALNSSLFLDEVYGRSVEIGQSPTAAKMGVFVDSTQTHSSAAFNGTPTSPDYYVLTLKIDHPFASGSLQYGDQNVTKIFPVFDWSPSTLSLVLGVGRNSPTAAAKLSRERAADYLQNDYRYGSLRRNQLGPAWLAQFSRALWLHARIANQRETPLHTIGFSFEIATAGGVVGPGGAEGWSDATALLDLDTTIALTPNAAGLANRRRAAIHAIALTAATLEGSVSEQSSGSPDSISTARRFANLAGAETETLLAPPNGLFRRINAAESLPIASDFSSGTPAWTYGASTLPALQSALSAYHAKEYDIVVGLDALMGPGAQYGTRRCCEFEEEGRYPSTQRGGAFVAVKYDTAGDPIAIANVTTNYYTATKGGGGNEPTTGKRDSADLLKDRFVDRSPVLGVDLRTGAAGYTSPVVASRGNGEFPFRLDETLSIRGGALKADDVPNLTGGPYVGMPDQKVADGLVSSFDGSAELSSSGLEAMGQSRLDAAGPTLAAFALMQDVFLEAPGQDREVVAQLAADWWGRKLIRNVVTVHQGAGAEQFVEIGVEAGSRLFVPSAGGPEKVLVAGFGQDVRPDGGRDQQSNRDIGPLTYRIHLDTGTTISYFDGQGNSKIYDYWRFGRYQGDLFNDQIAFQQGFRLKSWNFANGISLTFNYLKPPLQEATAFQTPGAVPVSVASNLGFTLSLSTAPRIALAADIYNGFSQLCTSLAPDGTLSLYPSPIVLQQSFTDAAGKTYRVRYERAIPRSTSSRPIDTCLLKEVYTPLDTTIPSLRYSFDAVGRVKEARDGLALAGSRLPHKFFYADGYRGEREDPTGGRYAVEWLQGGHRSRTIDELGRVTASLLDGRGRASERTYPEGDRDAFVYDVRSNLLSITRHPKPGSPLTPTVKAMTFGEPSTVWNCVNWVTCNKPTALDGPRTDVTDVTNFSWSATTGDLTQILKPADGSGVRPQIDLVYTVNPAGVSLLTSRAEKITSASDVVTTFEYDAANFYVLKSSTVDPSGLALKTCYQINTKGDIVGVSDPRTTTCPVSPP